MSLKQNPRIPEGINHVDEHPLKEFFWLSFSVIMAIVILVTVLSYSARFLAPYIPFTWEQALTDSLSVEGLLSVEEQELSEAQLAIDVLGQQLLQYVDFSYVDKLQFHLVDIDAPNAFATLGGHIFVTTGLLETVHSENALAMVMAHEIAHVILRHPIQSLSSGVVTQLLLLAISGHGGAVAVQQMLGQAGVMTMLSFSRDMEAASDNYALALMQSHYGHVKAADEFFLVMAQKQQEPEWVEVFKTHPNVSERLEVIQWALNNDKVVGVGDSTAQLTPLDSRLTDLIRRRNHSAKP